MNATQDIRISLTDYERFILKFYNHRVYGCFNLYFRLSTINTITPTGENDERYARHSHQSDGL